MPKSQTIIGSSVFTAANVANIPVSFEQGINQAPSGMAITVTPMQYKLTDADTPKKIKRDAVLARFVMNPPHREEVILASRLYAKIRQLVENWDRTHLDSFYSTRPDLMIAAESEISTFRLDLKLNAKKLAARNAEYYTRYSEIKMMQTASLLNLISLTRLNGDERSKAIARDLKWAWINGHANRYQRFPSFGDDENYLISNTKLAVGKTTYGADIVAFGQWIVDIYGNKALQSLPLEEIYTTASDGDNTYSPLKVSEANTPLADFFSHLGRTIQVFGSSPCMSGFEDAKEISGLDDPALARGIPTMPKVENPWLFVAQSNDARKCGGHMNTNTERFQKYKRYNIDDNLTARCWQAYDFWTYILETEFSDMADPQSDIRLFAAELGIIKDSTKIEDILKMVRANKAFDMSSLAQAMTYRDGNGKRPVTATVVRFTPAFPRWSDNDGSMAAHLQDNFDRFNLYEDDPRKVLSAAQRWPHLTPSTFPVNTGADKPAVEPRVLNGLPTFGTATIPTKDAIKRKNTLTGKNAVLLDLQKIAAFYDDNDGVTAYGVTKDVLQDSLTYPEGTYVFEEDPTQVYYYQLPLIDNSDPFQCGFDLMISHDDPQDNAWSEFFKDTKNKYDTTSLSAVTKITAGDDVDAPSAPAYAFISDASGWKRENVANPDYLAFRKHCFIFIGGDIFNHPVFRYAHPYVDMPVSMQMTTGLPKFCQDYINPDASEVSYDGSIGQLIYASFAQPNGGQERIVGSGSAAEMQRISSFEQAMRILAENLGDDKADANIVFTDPAYGPVNIIFALPPADQGATALPRFQGENFSYANLGSNEKLSVTAGITQISKGVTNVAAVKIADAYIKRVPSDGTIAPNAWLWFIGKTIAKYAYVDSGKMVIPASDSYKSVKRVFGDQNDWYEHLTSMLTAMYLGTGGQTPFWSPIAPKAVKVDISETASLPQSDIMAEPREIRSTKQNNSAMHNTKPTSRLQAQFEAANSFFSKSSQNREEGGMPDRNDRSSSKRRRGKSKRNHSSDTSVRTSSVTDVITKEPSAGLSTNGSSIDSSSDKTDREMNNQRKQGSGEKDNAQVI